MQEDVELVGIVVDSHNVAVDVHRGNRILDVFGDRGHELLQHIESPALANDVRESVLALRIVPRTLTK
jgi:hypothetical protein